MIRQISNWKTGLKLAVTGVLLLAGVTHYAQDNMSVLRVKNGKLYKDGKEYRGFGLNASYLSDKVLNVGKDAKESFKAIEYLGKKKIPYVRTWLGYLGNWKPYFNDEKKYWENMDLLVDAFEKANVGLIPTLFWKHEYIPWEFNESQKDMMNPDSKGRKFMAEYTKKFINRYKDRKIIWMWEWSNESNYAWNLPHERKKKNQNDVLTHELGMTISKAFAEEARRLDPYRPLSTGNGSVREDFYNRAMNLRNLWKKDTLAEQLIAAKWCTPDPYDTLSIHRYMYWQDGKCDMKPFVETVDRHMALAKKLKKPLFIGEFGLLLKDSAGKKNWTATPDINMKDYKKAVREMYQILYEKKVPLAAWWVYTDRKTSFHIGVINQDNYTDYEWIVDIINEYNEKLARDLK